MKQKFKTFRLLATAAAMALLPSSILADDAVELVNWNFDSGFTATTADGITIYEPNSESFSAIGTQWFSSASPYFRPQSSVLDASNYMLTALSSGRYWQVVDSYGTVLRIENADANDISDYTDASSHNVYFEASFPTTGYKNINVTYAIGAGNNTETPIETVVSTDGGTTWFDGGSATTSPYWWIYNDNTVALSANNKDNVKVRLIVGNGYSSNWNLNKFIVTGEEATAAAAIDVTGATVAWPFNLGTNNATTAEVSQEGAVGSSSLTIGSNLYEQGLGTAGDKTFTKINPYEVISSSPDDNSTISFSFIPKKGLTFTPTSVSFSATKFGTSGGTFDVYAISGDKKLTLGTGLNPTRSGVDDNYTTYTFDISELGECTEKIELLLYIYSLNSTKQVGVADVTFTTDIKGQPEDVPVYTLSAGSNVDGAGKVSTNPSGAEFDEGTQITATATENFGYHFTNWTDAEGNVVSTENPYTFEIADNTTLRANYTENNVYALNITLTNGARTNLLTVEPEGNLVDGVHYYEEGTDVKLTPVNNTILTFTEWEDQTTATERLITMDEEKNVTANFSACDYIVAWDLYDDEPGSERAADYMSDTENAGKLSLRTGAGGTTSWLALGSAKGGQNGKYGARIWKYLTDKDYFEITFSSKGYSNVRILNALGNDYNSYETMIEQYSIDGENYTEVGRFTIPSRGWDSQDFTLPSEADNQEKVYVRWIPDYDGGMTGVTSDYDGTSIAEIFVLADADTETSTTPPALVQSNPADGAEGVSASGSIILGFDKAVALGEGSATIDGETLTPIVSGKNIVFKYSGLSYSTTYTFTVPAGLITDKRGNAYEGTTITFTTMERTQPTARLYDAVVAEDGTGDYATILEAIEAAPTGRTTPWLIFIKEGTYTGHHEIPSTKPYIHLIGQDRNKVAISDDGLCGGDNALSVDEGATVTAKANNLYFEGINFVNSWGYEQKAGPQALALYTQGDRVVLNKCGMLSYQDTWLTSNQVNRRQYSRNCFIEGAVDFIYGQGNVYFDQDTINIVRTSGGYIVAPNHAAETTWGYVFMNNLITAPGVPSQTSVWLGRPWHNEPKTVYINTTALVTIPAAGWYEHMGGLPKLWAEYNTMDANGSPVDLSNRNTRYWITDEAGDTIWSTAQAVLTAEEAAQYTIKNVLSGDDAWQPDIICEPCSAPEPVISNGTITWDAVPYAICYVVTKDGKVDGFTTDTQYEYTDGSTYSVQAANEYGGLSDSGTATQATGINTVSSDAAAVSKMYSIDGKRITTPRKGEVHIVKYNDGTVRKIK